MIFTCVWFSAVLLIALTCVEQNMSEVTLRVFETNSFPHMQPWQNLRLAFFSSPWQNLSGKCFLLAMFFFIQVSQFINVKSRLLKKRGVRVTAPFVKFVLNKMRLNRKNLMLHHNNQEKSLVLSVSFQKQKPTARTGRGSWGCPAGRRKQHESDKK